MQTSKIKNKKLRYLAIICVFAIAITISACQSSTQAWNDWVNGNLDVQTQKTITQSIGKFLKQNYNGSVKYNNNLIAEYESDFCGMLPDNTLSGKENKERFETLIIEEIETDSISEYCVTFMEFDGVYNITVTINP